jgi:Cof subfamily protein (haloacid dehalogenase superfamily)
MTGKMIFFDIDGTLLNHDKKIPLSTKEAIQALKEKGHEVAIATGRAPFMFQDLRKELNIQTYVSYNGQYVVLNGEVIYRNSLNKEALQTITDVAMSNNHPIVYMDHEDMKANVPHNEYIVESIHTLKIKKFPTHDPNYFKDREIYQSLLFCRETEEDLYEKKFNNFKFVRWHPVSVDVVPAGGSKAKGLDQIIEKLGISKENVFAFGDGLNDVEMLTSISNSVAMGNGHYLAKKAAKFITKSVEEDGILYGLQMVGLLE